MAKNKTMWLALSTVGNLGLAIAVPIAIFGLIGRFLDKHYNTSPWFLLLGIFLALITTSVTLGVKIVKLLKAIEKASPERPRATPTEMEGESRESRGVNAGEKPKGPS